MADQVRDSGVEGYPSDWVRLVVAVSPSGIYHAIGGDQAPKSHPGEEDRFYGLERMEKRERAATASHAAEVEALRAFFRDVAELTMDHDRIELPGGDYAVVYPNKLGQALAKVDPNWTRAALKGDKP